MLNRLLVALLYIRCLETAFEGYYFFQSSNYIERVCIGICDPSFKLRYANQLKTTQLGTKATPNYQKNCNALKKEVESHQLN